MSDGEPDDRTEGGTRVGVVGAGVTGLALTHYLREQGADPVTFEATDRPGGVVQSKVVDGHVLEQGPQRVRLSGPLADLVADLGLVDAAVAADADLPLYVYADGRLRQVPLSLQTFLTTDLLSWRGKLRLLKEPLTDAGDPRETAAELFTRKFGREAYENVIGPLFGGIFGSDPARMPAAYALENLIRLESREGSLLKPAVQRLLGGESSPTVAFEDGNERLAEALYEANSERIRLERPVETVRDAGEGFELQADGESVAVDEVVVTAPADAAADVLERIEPDAARLRELTYNPLAMVYLRATHGREGLGYRVRYGEPLRTLGVSWNGPAFGHGERPGADGTRTGVHTCFLGGMPDREVLEQSDDDLARIAREEFEAVMGTSAAVIHVARPEWGFPAYDESWTALDGLSTPGGVHLATNYTARMGVPARVREAKRLADRLADGE
ncbi:protoporphyrinogen oxidase [Halobacteriales archaeon QS_1_68_20]|nr:MAG: protoporphyrinogen oxidase [Halobacteriales archaeon QS_1_68_20]